MCNVGDDNFEEDVQKFMIGKEKLTPNSTCNKCRTTKPCVLLRTKDAYCKDCFLTATVHKFKALLGKSRLIKHNDKVLVLHQIGHPSTALLHFLRTGLDLTTHKKLRFEPIILFIDDLYHINSEEKQELLEKIDKEVKSFGFDVYFVSFPLYRSNKQRNIVELITKNWNEPTLTKENTKELFQNSLDLTSNNDIYHIEKRNLLVQIAKYLDCKFVFTPELSMDIAGQLLTNVSLGRGSNLQNDTGFCDNRDEVKILRPLRLFDLKELAFYNFFNNLEPLFVKQKEMNPYKSVQDLMKKFVKDLQVNYPATVTTILKTGDKLALPKESDNMKICEMCKGHIFLESEGNLSAAESTKFSHLVSTTKPDMDLPREERFLKTLQSFNNSSSEKYCYACEKLSDYFL